jgi:hypothetical protein
MPRTFYRNPRAGRFLALLALIGMTIGALTFSRLGQYVQPSVMAATTFTVTNTNDSGAGSLRQAINGAATGDTITFNIPTTDPGYDYAADAYIITLTSGQLFIDKNLTITGLGAEKLKIMRSMAGGTPNFRILETYADTPYPNTISINISGVTISNGHTGDGMPGILEGRGGFGGAIFVDAFVKLTLTNSAISGNQTGNGYAGADGGLGGAIFNAGRLTLINSTVSNNRTGNGGAGGGNGGDGGAIFNGDTADLLNVTVSGNRAGDGGSGGAGGNGGGIFNGPGGGVALMNVTVSNNQGGSGNGGGAGGSGGGVVSSSNNSGFVSALNTIIAGNSTPGVGADFFGGLYSQDYNLIGSTAGTTFAGTTTHNILNQSANLTQLANNGGQTQTMLPLTGSSAIDAVPVTNLPPDRFDLDGDNNKTEPVPFDQRGFSRVVGSYSDIGAVETHDPADTSFPVSGRVTDINGNGIGDVTLTVSGAASGQTFSTLTDSQGNYSFNNTVGGDTLTPSKSGYTFSPSMVRAVSSSGIVPITGAYNFTGGTATYTLSGKVINGAGAALSNVQVTLSGSGQGIVQTDAQGNYSIAGLFAGGNYTITPTLHGYVFNPTRVVYNNLSANRTQTFVGTTHPYTISGQVKDAGNNGLSNVSVTLSRAGGTETIVALTNASGNYTFSNVAWEATYTVTTNKTGFTFNPPSATFSNPVGNQTANFTALPAPIVQFSQATYTFNEADPLGYAAITVNRTHDTTVASTVDYITTDNSQLVPCQTNTNGIASDRCDYVTASGTLRFAAGETSKTIQIPLINDSYVEPDESFTISLRNISAGSTVGTSIAIVTIQSDDTQAATQNPIDNQAVFIKQQYVDFLGRVAEQAGFDFWNNRMNNCPQGQTCDRIDTSQRFFQSDEFQERGFYVYRLYDAVLGRLPKYAEFVPDVARLNGPQTVQEQRLGKDAYLLDFMNKAEFIALYDQYLSANHLTATDAAGFVNALCTKSGITPANKQTLISNLQTGVKDPAHTLEDFILTQELSSIGTPYYDRGFITMQYFGYLRRDPDAGGFNFWVGQLIGPNAPHKQDYRFMVGGFLQSDEYRFRFALISN